MIKVKYFDEETFIIDEGKLITESPGLRKVFNSMYKVILPQDGEPDFILAKRLIKLTGSGKVVVKVVEQSEPGRVY